MSRSGGYMAALILLTGNWLFAQKVLYSPSINDRAADRFEIIGKAGDYYWVQKNKKKNQVVLPAMPWTTDRQPSFGIYDQRLNEVRTIEAPPIADSTLKEYFVCSDNYFDQLSLVKAGEKILLSLQRYDAAGTNTGLRLVDSLSFAEAGNNFLLLRSEDQEKILLLCFETIQSAAPRLHSLLYDKDWNLLSCQEYDHRFISQPLIQYDFFNYPLEHFSSSPVKLTNKGDFLMLAPSGRNQNYSLFIFPVRDSVFVNKEIRLPASSSVEDLALAVNNENGDATAGILSRFRYSTLKSVQVSRYSFVQQKIVYDSAFRFNTFVNGKTKQENLYEESFVAVPKAGFMLLKEYGKNYHRSLQEGEKDNDDAREILFANNIAGHDQDALINTDEYTRYNILGGPRSNYKRGDLNLFYFPAYKTDSCWSGIIDKQQTTELNSSYLSYAVVPAADRLYFLYNSLLRNEQQYGSTTILNHNGEEITDDGIIFSQIRNTLQFQKARQISRTEIAVPCQDSRKSAFAIIRF